MDLMMGKDCEKWFELGTERLGSVAKGFWKKLRYWASEDVSEVLTILMASVDFPEKSAAPQQFSETSGKMFASFGHKNGGKGLKNGVFTVREIWRGFRSKAQEDLMNEILLPRFIMHFGHINLELNAGRVRREGGFGIQLI